jgi:hypothetical protein
MHRHGNTYHSVHATVVPPDTLYCPAEQFVPLTTVLPAGQYFPATATQAPEQDDVFSPVLAPYNPAGHGLHDAD